MKENKVFKTAIVPILLMIIGLNHYIQDVFLSIVIGICIYIAASFIDRIKKR